MKISLSHSTSVFSMILSVLILSACSASTPTSVSTVPDFPPSATDLLNLPAALPTTTNMRPPATSPTPAPLPIPTVLPDAKLYVINLSQKENAPDDMYEQLFTYIIGGGGGNFGDTSSTTPSWVSAYAGATLPAVPQYLYWSVQTTAPSPAQQASLTLPNGSILKLDLNIGIDYVSVSYEIAPGAPLGTYSLELLQGDTRLQDSWVLEMPTKPIHVQYNHIDWFAGYKPNEPVTISLYYSTNAVELQEPKVAAFFPELSDYITTIDDRESSSVSIDAFLKQQTITTDEYGAFQIKVTTEQLIEENIYAIAPGEKSSFNAGVYSMTACGELQPSRLNTGDTARVIESSKTNLPLGTLLTVVFGPICSTSESQWQWLTSGWRRYIPESDANGYFLELVSPAVMPSPIPGNAVPTAGALSVDVLKNFAYTLPINGSLIQLVDGEYKDESGGMGIDPLTVTLLDPIALGDLNGDGLDDAAVLLAENNGANHTWVSLVVILNQDGQPVQSFSAHLGTDSAYNNLTVEDGKIVIHALIIGPNDPLCCPSKPVMFIYQLTYYELYLVSTSND